MVQMLAAAAVPAEPLDELTLRRAQRGDERAWCDLVRRYQQPVHQLIWRMFARRAQHRVEDLVQETFVRVLRALPGFEPAGPASLATWVLTIATRLALNELRRPELAALEAEPPVESDPSALAHLDRRRLAAAISTGVANLPDAQRAVFVLREYHDLDYGDIASVLEIDLNTVKSRLSRARAAMRAHLESAVPEYARRGAR
jgi:RNA polymerase sigma-70 factor (ECF subfamily)